MNPKQTIAQLIIALTEQCQLLIDLLIQDKDYLAANNIDLIEDSNRKKALINNTMLELMNTLEHHEDPFSLNDHQLMLTLKHDILTFNQIAQVNRNIVNANLVYTKDIFSALFGKKINNDSSVYTEEGTAI